jgi:predicted secreted protein
MRLDFRDNRSRRVVFVPHCALNQNARVAGAAVQPAAFHQLINGLIERGVGIIQMPCPELLLLGLDRSEVPIRTRLEDEANREQLRRMAAEIVSQAHQYRQCGVEVLAILGKDGSPTCGVDLTWDGGIMAGSGVFIQELLAELQRAGVQLKVTGIQDALPEGVLPVLLSEPRNRPVRP